MKKYQIIYADPPWHYSSGIRSSKKVGGKYQYYTPASTVGAKYQTQSNSWISALPVATITAEDAVLFLWTTDSHLPIALHIISEWGFTYRTIGFVWNKKEQSGKQVCYYGKWTMKGTELCLLATRGHPHRLIKSHRVRQLVEAARNRACRSSKPSEVRDRIVMLLGDLPRIELFARQRTPGWDIWGNEVESDIELTLPVGRPMPLFRAGESFTGETARAQTTGPNENPSVNAESGKGL